MPWLRYSDRMLVGIASILQARVQSDNDVGIQAMNLLRLCLGQMGATPTDFGKIGWHEDTYDPDDELFSRS